MVDFRRQAVRKLSIDGFTVEHVDNYKSLDTILDHRLTQ